MPLKTSLGIQEVFTTGSHYRAREPHGQQSAGSPCTLQAWGGRGEGRLQEALSPTLAPFTLLVSVQSHTTWAPTVWGYTAPACFSRHPLCSRHLCKPYPQHRPGTWGSLTGSRQPLYSFMKSFEAGRSPEGSQQLLLQRTRTSWLGTAPAPPPPITGILALWVGI